MADIKSRLDQIDMDRELSPVVKRERKREQKARAVIEAVEPHVGTTHTRGTRQVTILRSAMTDAQGRLQVMCAITDGGTPVPLSLPIVIGNPPIDVVNAGVRTEDPWGALLNVLFAL